MERFPIPPESEPARTLVEGATMLSRADANPIELGYAREYTFGGGATGYAAFNASIDAACHAPFSAASPTININSTLSRPAQPAHSESSQRTRSEWRMERPPPKPAAYAGTHLDAGSTSRVLSLGNAAGRDGPPDVQSNPLMQGGKDTVNSSFCAGPDALTVSARARAEATLDSIDSTDSTDSTDRTSVGDRHAWVSHMAESMSVSGFLEFVQPTGPGPGLEASPVCRARRLGLVVELTAACRARRRSQSSEGESTVCRARRLYSHPLGSPSKNQLKQVLLAVADFVTMRPPRPVLETNRTSIHPTFFDALTLPAMASDLRMMSPTMLYFTGASTGRETSAMSSTIYPYGETAPNVILTTTRLSDVYLLMSHCTRGVHPVSEQLLLRGMPLRLTNQDSRVSARIVPCVREGVTWASSYRASSLQASSNGHVGNSLSSLTFTAWSVESLSDLQIRQKSCSPECPSECSSECSLVPLVEISHARPCCIAAPPRSVQEADTHIWSVGHCGLPYLATTTFRSTKAEIESYNETTLMSDIISRMSNNVTTECSLLEGTPRSVGFETTELAHYTFIEQLKACMAPSPSSSINDYVHALIHACGVRLHGGGGKRSRGKNRQSQKPLDKDVAVILGEHFTDQWVPFLRSYSTTVAEATVTASRASGDQLPWTHPQLEEAHYHLFRAGHASPDATEAAKTQHLIHIVVYPVIEAELGHRDTWPIELRRFMSVMKLPDGYTYRAGRAGWDYPDCAQPNWESIAGDASAQQTTFDEEELDDAHDDAAARGAAAPPVDHGTRSAGCTASSGGTTASAAGSSAGHAAQPPSGAAPPRRSVSGWADALGASDGLTSQNPQLLDGNQLLRRAGQTHAEYDPYFRSANVPVVTQMDVVKMFPTPPARALLSLLDHAVTSLRHAMPVFQKMAITGGDMVFVHAVAVLHLAECHIRYVENSPTLRYSRNPRDSLDFTIRYYVKLFMKNYIRCWHRSHGGDKAFKLNAELFISEQALMEVANTVDGGSFTHVRAAFVSASAATAATTTDTFVRGKFLEEVLNQGMAATTANTKNIRRNFLQSEDQVLVQASGEDYERAIRDRVTTTGSDSALGQAYAETLAAGAMTDHDWRTHYQGGVLDAPTESRESMQMVPFNSASYAQEKFLTGATEPNFDDARGQEYQLGLKRLFDEADEARGYCVNECELLQNAKGNAANQFIHVVATTTRLGEISGSRLTKLDQWQQSTQLTSAIPMYSAAILGKFVQRDRQPTVIIHAYGICPTFLTGKQGEVRDQQQLLPAIFAKFVASAMRRSLDLYPNGRTLKFDFATQALRGELFFAVHLLRIPRSKAFTQSYCDLYSYGIRYDDIVRMYLKGRPRLSNLRIEHGPVELTTRVVQCRSQWPLGEVLETVPPLIARMFFSDLIPHDHPGNMLLLGFPFATTLYMNVIGADGRHTCQCSNEAPTIAMNAARRDGKNEDEVNEVGRRVAASSIECTCGGVPSTLQADDRLTFPLAKVNFRDSEEGESYTGNEYRDVIMESFLRHDIQFIGFNNKISTPELSSTPRYHLLKVNMTSENAQRAVPGFVIVSLWGFDVVATVIISIVKRSHWDKDWVKLRLQEDGLRRMMTQKSFDALVLRLYPLTSQENENRHYYAQGAWKALGETSTAIGQSFGIGGGSWDTVLLATLSSATDQGDHQDSSSSGRYSTMTTLTERRPLVLRNHDNTHRSMPICRKIINDKVVHEAAIFGQECCHKGECGPKSMPIGANGKAEPAFSIRGNDGKQFVASLGSHSKLGKKFLDEDSSDQKIYVCGSAVFIESVNDEESSARHHSDSDDVEDDGHGDSDDQSYRGSSETDGSHSPMSDDLGDTDGAHSPKSGQGTPTDCSSVEGTTHLACVFWNRLDADQDNDAVQQTKLGSTGDDRNDITHAAFRDHDDDDNGASGSAGYLLLKTPALWSQGEDDQYYLSHTACNGTFGDQHGYGLYPDCLVHVHSVNDRVCNAIAHSSNCHPPISATQSFGILSRALVSVGVAYLSFKVWFNCFGKLQFGLTSAQSPRRYLNKGDASGGSPSQRIVRIRGAGDVGNPPPPDAESESEEDSLSFGSSALNVELIPESPEHFPAVRDITTPTTWVWWPRSPSNECWYLLLVILTDWSNNLVGSVGLKLREWLSIYRLSLGHRLFIVHARPYLSAFDLRHRTLGRRVIIPMGCHQRIEKLPFTVYAARLRTHPRTMNYPFPSWLPDIRRLELYQFVNRNNERLPIDSIMAQHCDNTRTLTVWNHFNHEIDVSVFKNLRTLDLLPREEKERSRPQVYFDPHDGVILCDETRRLSVYSGQCVEAESLEGESIVRRLLSLTIKRSMLKGQPIEAFPSDSPLPALSMEANNMTWLQELAKLSQITIDGYWPTLPAEQLLRSNARPRRLCLDIFNDAHWLRLATTLYESSLFTRARYVYLKWTISSELSEDEGLGVTDVIRDMLSRRNSVSNNLRTLKMNCFHGAAPNDFKPLNLNFLVPRVPYSQTETSTATLNGLTVLKLAGLKAVHSVYALGTCPNLRVLALYNMESLHDISPLGSLLMLEELFLECAVHNLRPLNNCVRLFKLSLNGCNDLTQLSPLRNVELLRAIRITGCQRVTSLVPLLRCPHLRAVLVRHCPCVVLSPGSAETDELVNKFTTLRALLIVPVPCSSSTRHVVLHSCRRRRLNSATRRYHSPEYLGPQLSSPFYERTVRVNAVDDVFCYYNGTVERDVDANGRTVVHKRRLLVPEFHAVLRRFMTLGLGPLCQIGCIDKRRLWSDVQMSVGFARSHHAQLAADMEVMHIPKHEIDVGHVVDPNKILIVSIDLTRGQFTRRKRFLTHLGSDQPRQSQCPDWMFKMPTSMWSFQGSVSRPQNHQYDPTFMSQIPYGDDLRWTSLGIASSEHHDQGSSSTEHNQRPVVADLSRVTWAMYHVRVSALHPGIEVWPCAPAQSYVPHTITIVARIDRNTSQWAIDYLRLLALSPDTAGYATSNPVFTTTCYVDQHGQSVPCVGEIPLTWLCGPAAERLTIHVVRGLPVGLIVGAKQVSVEWTHDCRETEGLAQWPTSCPPSPPSTIPAVSASSMERDPDASVEASWLQCVYLALQRLPIPSCCMPDLCTSHLAVEQTQFDTPPRRIFVMDCDSAPARHSTSSNALLTADERLELGYLHQYNRGLHRSLPHNFYPTYPLSPPPSPSFADAMRTTRHASAGLQAVHDDLRPVQYVDNWLVQVYHPTNGRHDLHGRLGAVAHLLSNSQYVDLYVRVRFPLPNVPLDSLLYEYVLLHPDELIIVGTNSAGGVSVGGILRTVCYHEGRPLHLHETPTAIDRHAVIQLVSRCLVTNSAERALVDDIRSSTLESATHDDPNVYGDDDVYLHADIARYTEQLRTLPDTQLLAFRFSVSIRDLGQWWYDNYATTASHDPYVGAITRSSSELWPFWDPYNASRHGECIASHAQLTQAGLYDSVARPPDLFSHPPTPAHRLATLNRSPHVLAAANALLDLPSSDAASLALTVPAPPAAPNAGSSSTHAHGMVRERGGGGTPDESVTHASIIAASAATVRAQLEGVELPKPALRETLTHAIAEPEAYGVPHVGRVDYHMYSLVYYVSTTDNHRTNQEAFKFNMEGRISLRTRGGGDNQDAELIIAGEGTVNRPTRISRVELLRTTPIPPIMLTFLRFIMRAYQAGVETLESERSKYVRNASRHWHALISFCKYNTVGEVGAILQWKRLSAKLELIQSIHACSSLEEITSSLHRRLVTLHETMTSTFVVQKLTIPQLLQKLQVATKVNMSEMITMMPGDFGTTETTPRWIPGTTLLQLLRNLKSFWLGNLQFMPPQHDCRINPKMPIKGLPLIIEVEFGINKPPEKPPIPMPTLSLDSSEGMTIVDILIDYNNRHVGYIDYAVWLRINRCSKQHRLYLRKARLFANFMTFRTSKLKDQDTHQPDDHSETNHDYSQADPFSSHKPYKNCGLANHQLLSEQHILPFLPYSVRLRGDESRMAKFPEWLATVHELQICMDGGVRRRQLAHVPRRVRNPEEQRLIVDSFPMINYDFGDTCRSTKSMTIINLFDHRLRMGNWHKLRALDLIPMFQGFPGIFAREEQCVRHYLRSQKSHELPPGLLRLSVRFGQRFFTTPHNHERTAPFWFREKVAKETRRALYSLCSLTIYCKILPRPSLEMLPDDTHKFSTNGQWVLHCSNLKTLCIHGYFLPDLATPLASTRPSTILMHSPNQWETRAQDVGLFRKTTKLYVIYQKQPVSDVPDIPNPEDLAWGTGFQSICSLRDDQPLQEVTDPRRSYHLRVLKLHEVFKYKSTRSISGGSVIDCRFVHNLTQLEELHLTGVRHLSNIEAIATCPKLRVLRLHRAIALLDLRPIAHCKALTTLFLYCGSDDVSPLVYCSSLTDLTLSGCKRLTDIGPLGSIELRRVVLNGCRALRSIMPLCQCRRLVSLHIRHCPYIFELGEASSRLVKQVDRVRMLRNDTCPRSCEPKNHAVICTRLVNDSSGFRTVNYLDNELKPSKYGVTVGLTVIGTYLRPRHNSIGFERASKLDEAALCEVLRRFRSEDMTPCVHVSQQTQQKFASSRIVDIVAFAHVHHAAMAIAMFEIRIPVYDIYVKLIMPRDEYLHVGVIPNRGRFSLRQPQISHFCRAAGLYQHRTQPLPPADSASSSWKYIGPDQYNFGHRLPLHMQFRGVPPCEWAAEAMSMSQPTTLLAHCIAKSCCVANWSPRRSPVSRHITVWYVVSPDDSNHTPRVIQDIYECARSRSELDQMYEGILFESNSVTTLHETVPPPSLPSSPPDYDEPAGSCGPPETVETLLSTEQSLALSVHAVLTHVQHSSSRKIQQAVRKWIMQCQKTTDKLLQLRRLQLHVAWEVISAPIPRQIRITNTYVTPMNRTTEQQFEHRLQHLGLCVDIGSLREGPAHQIQHVVSATIYGNHPMYYSTNRVKNCIYATVGKAPRLRDARRQAIVELHEEIMHLQSPYPYTVNWADMGTLLKGRMQVYQFEQPPDWWFANNTVVGVDFEGQPPILALIGCLHGVAIDRIDAPWVIRVLSNTFLSHAIFGKHEASYVANPYNLQDDERVSLSAMFNRHLPTLSAFQPNVVATPFPEFLKDKRIHTRTNWSTLTDSSMVTEEQLGYMIFDAFAHYTLGCILVPILNPPPKNRSLIARRIALDNTAHGFKRRIGLVLVSDIKHVLMRVDCADVIRKGAPLTTYNLHAQPLTDAINSEDFEPTLFGMQYHFRDIVEVFQLQGTEQKLTQLALILIQFWRDEHPSASVYELEAPHNPINAAMPDVLATLAPTPTHPTCAGICDCLRSLQRAVTSTATSVRNRMLRIRGDGGTPDQISFVILSATLRIVHPARDNNSRVQVQLAQPQPWLEGVKLPKSIIGFAKIEAALIQLFKLYPQVQVTTRHDDATTQPQARKTLRCRGGTPKRLSRRKDADKSEPPLATLPLTETADPESRRDTPASAESVDATLIPITPPEPRTLCSRPDSANPTTLSGTDEPRSITRDSSASGSLDRTLGTPGSRDLTTIEGVSAETTRLESLHSGSNPVSDVPVPSPVETEPAKHKSEPYTSATSTVATATATFHKGTGEPGLSPSESTPRSDVPSRESVTKLAPVAEVPETTELPLDSLTPSSEVLPHTGGAVPGRPSLSCAPPHLSTFSERLADVSATISAAPPERGTAAAAPAAVTTFRPRLSATPSIPPIPPEVHGVFAPEASSDLDAVDLTRVQTQNINARFQRVESSLGREFKTYTTALGLRIEAAERRAQSLQAAQFEAIDDIRDRMKQEEGARQTLSANQQSISEGLSSLETTIGTRIASAITESEKSFASQMAASHKALKDEFKDDFKTLMQTLRETSNQLNGYLSDKHGKPTPPEESQTPRDPPQDSSHTRYSGHQSQTGSGLFGDATRTNGKERFHERRVPMPTPGGNKPQYARTAKTSQSAEYDRALLLVVYHKVVKSATIATDSPCSLTYHAWATIQDGVTADEGILSMPTCYVRNLDIVTDELSFMRYETTVRHFQMDPVDYMGEKVVQITRINCLVSDRPEVTSSEFCATLAGSESLGEVIAGISDLRRVMPLYQSWSACGRALGRVTRDVPPDRRGASRSLAFTWMAAIQAAPAVDGNDWSGGPNGLGREPSDRQDYRPDKEYRGGHEHVRRTPWSRAIDADIEQNGLATFHEGDSLQTFSKNCMIVLHTTPSSKIPRLLIETEAFKEYFSAVTSKIAKHSFWGGVLRDSHARDLLQTQLDGVERNSKVAFAECMAQPQEVYFQDKVADCIAEGLATVRAVLTKTSVHAILRSEALRLQRFVSDTPIETYASYVADVDNAWTHAISLWGRRQTLNLCSYGTLSQLLPSFLRRLDDSRRDHAIRYLNAVLHEFIDTYEREGLPTYYKKIIEQLLNSSSPIVCPEQRNERDHRMIHEVLGGPSDTTYNIGVFNSTMKSGRHVENRIITVPDDCWVFAELGCLFTRWRALIGRLMGNESRIRTTVVSPNVFEIDVHLGINNLGTGTSSSAYDGDFQNDEEDQSDSDSDEDGGTTGLMPVTRARSGDKPPSSVIRQPNQQPRDRPKKTRFVDGERIVDKMQKATETVGDRLGKEVARDTARREKVAEKMENIEHRLNDGISKSNALHEKQIEKALAKAEQTREDLQRGMQDLKDQIRRDSERAHTRNREELAHMARTQEQIMRNVAANASDLKHASELSQSATELGRNARAWERGATMPTNPSAPPKPAMTASENTKSTISAVLKRRTDVTPSNGLKLTHLPDNNYNEFSEPVKSLYKTRDGVHSSAEFIAIGDRICMNCDVNSRLMPHPEKVCPLIYSSTKAADEKLGQVRASRSRARLTQNMDRLKKGLTAEYNLNVIDISEMCMLMDQVEGPGHQEALINLIERAPFDVHESTDIDSLLYVMESTMPAQIALVGADFATLS